MLNPLFCWRSNISRNSSLLTGFIKNRFAGKDRKKPFSLKWVFYRGLTENRRFLKEKGIRFTGEPLGRKPAKEIKSRYQKRKELREAAERNQVEGKFGQGKRGYGLNDIRARLATTSNSWIGAIIFVMNLIRHMRDIPLSYFVSFLSKLMKVRNINIYPLGPQMKLCA